MQYMKKFMNIIFINLFLFVSLNSYLPKYLNNQDLDEAGIRQLNEAVKLMDAYPAGPITRSRFKRLPEHQQFLFKLDMNRHKVCNRSNEYGEIDSFYLENLKDKIEEDVVYNRVLSLVGEYFSSDDDAYLDDVFMFEVLPDIVSSVVDDEYVGVSDKVKVIKKKNFIQAFLDRLYVEMGRRAEADEIVRRFYAWIKS